MIGVTSWIQSEKRKGNYFAISIWNSLFEAGSASLLRATSFILSIIKVLQQESNTRKQFCSQCLPEAVLSLLRATCVHSFKGGCQKRRTAENSSKKERKRFNNVVASDSFFCTLCIYNLAGGTARENCKADKLLQHSF